MGLDPLARLLHQDGQVLILDKPSGLPVHRGPRGGASIEDWLPALAMGKKRLPQPAHRLDTDTAGCLVLGRTKPALAELGAIFAAGRAEERPNWAVVRGAPPKPAGTIDAPFAKRSTARDGWWMAVDAAGQPARTAWRVLGAAAGLTWLELRPKTGRTTRSGCIAPISAARSSATSAMAAAPAGWPGRPRHALPLDPPLAATGAATAPCAGGAAGCGWREP